MLVYGTLVDDGDTVVVVGGAGGAVAAIVQLAYQTRVQKSTLRTKE